jgi:hypothetical protein
MLLGRIVGWAAEYAEYADQHGSVVPTDYTD